MDWTERWRDVGVKTGREEAEDVVSAVTEGADGMPGPLRAAHSENPFVSVMHPQTAFSRPSSKVHQRGTVVVAKGTGQSAGQTKVAGYMRYRLLRLRRRIRVTMERRGEKNDGTSENRERV
jgi:hypothetical protein